MLNKNIKTLIAFSLILLSFQSKAFFGIISIAERIANQCDVPSDAYLNIVNKADKQLFNDNMTTSQVIEVAHKVEDNFKKWGQNCQERENATYALLGKNKLNKSYVKTPISAEDAVKLVVGLRNKKNLIVHLFDKSLIKTPINFQGTLKLTDNVRYGNRASFLDYLIKNKFALQSKISLDQAVDLLNVFKTKEYRSMVLIKLLDQQLINLPKVLSFQEATDLIGPSQGKDRFHAIRALAEKSLIPGNLNANESNALLASIDNASRLGTIRVLAENHLISNNLTTDEVLSIVHSLSDNKYTGEWPSKFYRHFAIRTLTNAKNPVIKTPINAEDLTKLLKGVKFQDKLTKHLIENQLIESSISIDNAVSLLNTVTHTRHKVIVELVKGNRLPKMSTAKQVTDLLHTQGEQKWYQSEYLGAIRALVAKDLIPNNLTTDEVLSIVHSLSDNKYTGEWPSKFYRHFAIRTLTNAKNPVIKTPINAEDLTKLLKGVKFQDKLTKHLIENQLIEQPLNADKATVLLDTLGRAEDRVEVIRTLVAKGLMPNNLNIDQALDIVGGMKDYHEYTNVSWLANYPHEKAVRALLNAKKPLIKTPINTEDLAKLIKGVTRKKELIAYLSKNQFIEQPLNADKVTVLLDTLGSFSREKVVTDLAQKGYLVKALTLKQVTDLLNVKDKQQWRAEDRVEVIRTLVAKGLMPNNLNIDQALDIVGGMKDYHEYTNVSWLANYPHEKAVRALLNAKKPLIKTPINTEDLAKLIKGVTRKKELIAYLTQHQFIE